MRTPIYLLSLVLTLSLSCGSVEKSDSDASSGTGRDGGGISDAAAADGSGPDATPIECEANTVFCDGEELRFCNAEGFVESSAPCLLGCASSGDRCLDVNPSNDLATYLDDADSGPDVMFAAAVPTTIINTDTGDVTHGGGPVTVPSDVVDQGAGLPDIRVFRVKSLTIQNEVEVQGSNALAIVSDGNVTIGAVVEIAGRWTSPGPGAITSASAGCKGTNGNVLYSVTRVPGGGGAGHQTAGQSGGNAARTSYTTAFGGAGGAPGGTSTIEPLRGGCQGGSVPSPGDAYYATVGGGGGGAMQIVSRGMIVVTSSGIIDAGGGGGQGYNSGSGGGSGGSILLEAPEVIINGTLAANGGGGGCFDLDGEDGRVAYAMATLNAQGGDCSIHADSSLGDGGNGGSKDSPPTGGESVSVTSVVPIAGGGGGAVGRIRVNTASGNFAKGGSSLISPIAGEASIGTR